jgi:hypothetical protein
MTRFFPRPLASIVLLVLGFLLTDARGEPIKPPFKLEWGETPQRLERLLTKVPVVDRRTLSGREVWEVHGILEKDLQRTLFYFKDGALVEVELQYKTTGWAEEKYNGFMGDLRRTLTEKYGEPELIAKKEEPLGEVIQKVVGWKWNRDHTGVELYYFSAENATQTFRTLSVHYKSY